MAIRDFLTSDELTPRQATQRDFLLALSRLEVPIISRAAKECGISAHTVYAWKRNDPKFAEALEDLFAVLGDIGEGELIRRAIVGVDKPVFHQGEIVGHVREYSDTLLLAFVKATKPAYRDRTQVDVNDLSKLPDDELDARLIAVERALGVAAPTVH